MNSSMHPDHGGKKYLIAAAALRRDIEAGKYAIDEKLPAAGNLGKQYGVSKPPMDRALNILKEEGWLISYVGDGTYVQDWTKLKSDLTDGSGAEVYEQIMTKLSTVVETLEEMDRRLTQLERHHGATEPETSGDRDVR